jgi:hypothetical protein
MTLWSRGAEELRRKYTVNFRSIYVFKMLHWLKWEHNIGSIGMME